MANIPKPHFLEIHEGAAAQWSASTDVMDQDTDVSVFKTVPYPRILRNAGVVGDTAADPEGIKITIGGQMVAKLRASATASLSREQLKPIDCPVEPNETVVVTPTGASATNEFIVALDFDVDYARLASMARMMKGGRRY